MEALLAEEEAKRWATLARPLLPRAAWLTSPRARSENMMGALQGLAAEKEKLTALLAEEEKLQADLQSKVRARVPCAREACQIDRVAVAAQERELQAAAAAVPDVAEG